MSKTYTIAEVLNQKVPVDSEVVLKGWVRTRRDSKAGFSFIALHDGSCFSPIQVVAPNTLANYENEILKLTAGCSIVVHGKVVASPGQGQSVEIQANSIEVLGFVDDPETYPISPKHHTLEYLREHAHLRIRTNTIGAVMRVRSCLGQAIHRFFHEQGFYWIHTPIITTSDCEGAGEMFRVSTLDLQNLPRKENGQINFAEDFFGKETFLTVSGQLNAESYCLAMSKVYTFGPTFRSENSNTSRHLAEFWMIEPEIAFANLLDDAKLAEDLLRYCFKAVLEERADDMAFFAQRVDKDCITRLENILQHNFEHMDYTDAIKHLQNANKKFDYPVEWGLDLQSEHERYLAEELVGKPVILMNYPKDIKAFYMRLNDDGKTVAAMDVLAPGIGEIIGGSQREERLEILDQRMTECHLNPADYQWYRDLRRYGSVPHAGFGLGFERLVSYVTGVSNVRDVIPFPRTPKHAQY
ncbi:MAG: asparagine--tRNA ligase [Gammaproteobacteria bacterium]|jgi:asparaginyl-tRNA synthetase|nr:asparagine--tRNA ligase [Gammaproteobacteria bacterium]